MPRSVKRQTRAPEGAPIPRPAARLPAGPSRRLIHQCSACGALVDALFGEGDESYCPHCHTGGTVWCREGVIPDPQLYGQWLRKQEEAEKAKRCAAEAGRHSSPNPEGGMSMKHRKLHSGTYHCPACLIEYDLTLEESLKCDQCGGPLAKGDLDALWEDEDADDDDADPR